MRVVRSLEPSSRPTWWTLDRSTPPLSTPTTYTGPHSKSCLKWNRWGDGDWLKPREGWNSSLYFLCYLVFGINWPKSVVFYLYGQTGSYGGSREKLGTDLNGGGGQYLVCIETLPCSSFVNLSLAQNDPKRWDYICMDKQGSYGGSREVTKILK